MIKGWCSDCHSVSMWHCSDPLHCGGMMIKRYCDICEQELGETNAILTKDMNEVIRLTTRLQSKNSDSVLTLALITSLNGTSNNGDFCKYCVLDAFYQLDDRNLSNKRLG